jgi:dTDP-4-dehydrorhamnose 3,5-epimerase
MQVERLSIPDVVAVTPARHGDARGFFSETFVRARFEAAGLPADFVQDNHSWSAEKGVVRGLHFQIEPASQGKLVRCTRGAVYDVAVDLRAGSPSYGRHVARVLSAENWTQLWVPAGFAHGFCTLEENCEVLYKVTAPYEPACDRGLAWDDPALAIPWPVEAERAILSDKDRRQPRLADLPVHFRYEGAR